MMESLRVGAEYSNAGGTRFRAFLKEIAGKLPYRIQSYDKTGFFGHYEVRSIEEAVSELVIDLGNDIKEAPGSMDRLASAKEWEAWRRETKESEA